MSIFSLTLEGRHRCNDCWMINFSLLSLQKIYFYFYFLFLIFIFNSIFFLSFLFVVNLSILGNIIGKPILYWKVVFLFFFFFIFRFFFIIICIHFRNINVGVWKVKTVWLARAGTWSWGKERGRGKGRGREEEAESRWLRCNWKASRHKMCIRVLTKTPNTLWAHV